ncbi:MAG: Tm-1-like ATP-binding domain-containing protein [Geminicoccaceae bacterium]
MARAYVCGTLDSKATELGFIQACLEAAGVATCLVDLGTSGEAAPADVAAREVARHHRRRGRRLHRRPGQCGHRHGRGLRSFRQRAGTTSAA